MLRLTICVSILMIAGFVAMKWIDMQLVPAEAWPDVLARDKKVTEQAINYYAFKDSFNSLLASLQRGEISLAEGVEQVKRLANHHHADYFEHIGFAEEGDSLDERIARNLCGHVASLDFANPGLSSHRRQLYEELAEFLRGLQLNHGTN